MPRAWERLTLREYRPEPTVRVPGHEVSTPFVPAVDVHNHLGKNYPGEFHAANRGEWRVDDVAALVGLMDQLNLALIVNLDGNWGAELEANLGRYDRAYPGRFATFCRLNWDECATPGWPERIAKSVHDSSGRGATGVKIAKDLGLGAKDEHGRYVLCDDERLQPVWAAIAEEKLPVLIHVSDPAAFFEPLSERNERLEQLLAHPGWQFADRQFPGRAQLLEGLESLVSAHPEITFIGAHAGCNPENLAWVRRMLESYRNFNIDIAARVAELGRQPRATRRLVLAHPTRVLFGTDELPRPEIYTLYFRFLETDDEYFSHEGSEPDLAPRWMISAIDLPKDLLTGVYRTNAERIIPRLAAVLEPRGTSPVGGGRDAEPGR
jgi:predicted TIM-barrel fold metal-dependent hydrolase